MSRINTQDDRLARGVRPLESQRSFLVQSRRFAPAGSSLQGLAGAVSGIATAALSNREKAEAERKQKTDTATYNKLIEARNRANADPTTYGDEYIEMYQSSLERLDESDPFRTRILGLDADNFVSSRVEAEEQTLRGQITTGMRKTFIEIGNTYESLSPEENLEYAGLPENERYTRLYNEYLDSFLENDPEVHDAILNHTQLETLLSQEVDRRSQTFQSAHDSMLESQAQVRFQDTVDGIVTEYETVGSWDEGQMQALATRNGIPVETVQNAVIDRTLMSMQMDLEQGRLTLGDTSSKFQFLQAQAAKYGRDAEQLVYDAQGKFLSIAMQDVLNDSESKMYQGFRTGLPLEEIVQNSDTYLLSVLGDVTGEDYGEDASILTAEADIGIPNTLLAQLRDMHEAVQSGVEEVQRGRQARDNLKMKSSYQERLDSSSIHAVRVGDFSGLRGRFGGSDDIETAFNAGYVENISTSTAFPLGDKHAAILLEAFEYGNEFEQAWAMGGIAGYNEPALRNLIRSLDQEDQVGLLFVREAFEFAELDSTALKDPETIRTLKEKFFEGQSLAAEIGPVGSSSGKVKDAVVKKVFNSLGIDKSSKISSSAMLEIQLSKSKVDDLQMSDAKTARAIEMDMKTSGNTLFFDAATGMYEVFDDSGSPKLLPYSIGVSRDTVTEELDVRTTQIGEAYTTGVAILGSHTTIPGTSFLTSTPIIGSVIANSLGIDVTSERAALMEVAVLLTASKHSNLSIEDAKYDKKLLEGYYNLFQNDASDGDFLRLDIGTEAGRPYLMVTGSVMGTPLTGQDAILLTKWDPNWNYAFGKTHEQIDRAEKFQETAIDTALYFMNPDTLGNKAGNFVIDALESQERAYEANPDAFKVRP